MASGSVLAISSISMPPRCRGNHANALGLTVEHIAEIELALERLGDLDIDPLHGLAFRPGLDGDQAPAEHLLRRLANLVIGPAELDAAGLATRAGMDLGLDRPMPAAELGRGIDRLVGAEGDGALRHRHAELREQILRLIFVDVHLYLPFVFLTGPGSRASAQLALDQLISFFGHSFRAGEKRLQFLHLSLSEVFVRDQFRVRVNI